MPELQRARAAGARADVASRTSPAGWPRQRGAVAAVLAAHEQAGHRFTAAGVRSFVREQGSGPAVVCVHGMIGTSFLYRKLLAELVAWTRRLQG